MMKQLKDCRNLLISIIMNLRLVKQIHFINYSIELFNNSQLLLRNIS
jgi:hypothetical protein